MWAQAALFKKVIVALLVSTTWLPVMAFAVSNDKANDKANDKGTSVAISQYPNIMWQREHAFDSYIIDIATDDKFHHIIDSDKIDNIARYVPAKSLKPGKYFWRVSSRKGGNKHLYGSFEIAKPANEIRIAAGSSMVEIRAALAQARKNTALSNSKANSAANSVFSTGTVIRFEQSTYHLHPGSKGAVFDIKDSQNLIIDGSGSKLIIHDIASIAQVSESEHITLQNFTVDYAAMLYTAAKVESVDEQGVMELSLLDGYRKPETVERFMQENRGMFYQAEVPKMAENIPLLVYMKEAWQPLGKNRYRLQAKNRAEVKEVKPGMIYISAPRYGGVAGFRLRHSNDVALVDVNTLFIPGIGVSTDYVNDLKVIRLNIKRRSDRLIGSQNGGSNIHNARIGPWFEGNTFENTGDDNSHISSLIMFAQAQPSKYEVLLSVSKNESGLGLDIAIGDKLAFFDRITGRVMTEALAVKVTTVGNKTKVTFDREIPPLKLEISTKGLSEDQVKILTLQMTQIFNLNRSCGNFAFRNNTFLRGRRIGILAKSGPGLIENNQFIELGSGGIEIWNAPFEGLYAHEILIQNNSFKNGGLVYNKKKHGPKAAIWLDMFAGKPSQQLHRDIVIKGNEIINYPGSAIEINDTRSIRIENNKISRDKSYKPRAIGEAALKLSNVSDLIQNNNAISGYKNVEQ